MIREAASPARLPEADRTAGAQARCASGRPPSDRSAIHGVPTGTTVDAGSHASVGGSVLETAVFCDGSAAKQARKYCKLLLIVTRSWQVFGYDYACRGIGRSL